MKKLSEWASNNRQFFSNKRIFYSVILLTFFSRLLIAVQPIEYIDGLLIHDDTYYLLTIAKNIAMGNGPFISDNFTNGFQPLFTFIIVPIFFLFPNDLIAPLNAALIISALFESITLAFFLKILATYCKSSWTLIAAALIWISNSYIILNSLNGLETALSVLLIVLTLYYFLKLREQEAISRKQFFILGIFAGFAALARVDNFLLLVSILAVITFEPYFNKVRKFYFKNTLCILAGTAIIYLPWLVYSYAYTGDFFQISGKALRLYTIFAKSDPNSSNIIGIIIAIKEVLLYNKKLVLAGSVTLLILFFVLRKKAAVNEVKEMMGLGLSLLSLFSLLLVISYGLYYYAFWFYGRYLYAIFLFFIFLFLFGLDRIIYTGKKWLMVYTVVIVSFMLITNIVSRSFYSFYISQQTRNFSLMVIANWVKDKMPPGSVIGSTQSGALEYFANNQKIINLDGVVNKAFYQSCQRKKAIEYIREKNIEYIIDWDSNINYFKYFSSNFKETDLKDIKTIEGFKSWGNCWHVYKVNY